MKHPLLSCLLLVHCGTSNPSEPDAGFQATECAPLPEDCVEPCQDDPGASYCKGSSGYDFIFAISSHDGMDTDDRETAYVDTEAVLSVPNHGTLCLEGTLRAADGYDTWAELILALDERTNCGTCVTDVFDAVALGASAIEFTLGEVPPMPLRLTARSIVANECPLPYLCTSELFTWLTPEADDVVLLHPGTQRAPFAEFVGNDSREPLDSRRISIFSLRLDRPSQDEDFDFCVSDVRFVNAEGDEVDPSW